MIYCINFKYDDKIPHNTGIMDEKKQKTMIFKKSVNM